MRLFIAFICYSLLAAPIWAQASADGFRINLRDTEIEVFAEQVAEITGRTLVLHPDLQGQISVVSPELLDKDGVWELFQSILKVRGFTASKSGVIWQVVPQSLARSVADLNEFGSRNGDQDYITRLLRLNTIPAADVLRVIAPLVSPEGTAEALNDPNAVVLTDTLGNVERLTRLVANLDGPEAETSAAISLAYGDAGSIRTALGEILGAGVGAKLSADAASNTLLAKGTAAELQEVRRLVALMDIPPEQVTAEQTQTQVFRLKFGDAEGIADILRSTLSRSLAATNAVADDLQAAPGAGEVSIEASTELNAVIANGTNAQLAEVSRLITELDQRRAQVSIEAAIVEVSGDAAKRLNVQLGLGGLAPPGGLAATSFGGSGSSLQSILATLGVPQAALATPGLSAGLATDDFGVLVQALNISNKARLLSTPSVTTMDNQPASIVVGQNVPFRTGSFATNGNTAEPFTVIERRDVGIRMDVLPRVTSGDVVRLEIVQEVSSLVPTNLEGAADLITNKRAVQTSVLADNGSTIVLGGLISNDTNFQQSGVPGLENAPLVGGLFRNRSRSKADRTLFIFLRPTILRDAEDVRLAAKRRLQTIRVSERAITNKAVKPSMPIPLEIQGLY